MSSCDRTIRQLTALPIGRSGFTFIELLIVLVVIGVFAGSVVVSLERRDDLHALRLASEDLATGLRYAVAKSAMEHRTYWIVFDDGWRGFHIEVASSDADVDKKRARGVAGQKRVFGEGCRIVAVELGGQSIDPLPDMLLLNADGSGFIGSVLVVNADGEIVTVEITAETRQVCVTAGGSP